MKSKLARLPSAPGVYLFMNKDNLIIYIGAASNLKRRVSSYFQKNHQDLKTKALSLEIFNFDYEIHDSIETTFLRERELIGKHKPKFNIRFKDDKDYPRLKITTSEEYPRLLLVREEDNGKDTYFGKKFNVYQFREGIKHIRKAFKLSSCNSPIKSSGNNKKRPCLDFHLGLCSAPCSGKISKEDYQKQVRKLIEVLNGNKDNIFQIWEAEMLDLGQSERYEEAAEIRDRIKTIDSIARRLRGNFSRDLDIIMIKTTEKLSLFAIYMIINNKIANEEQTKLPILHKIDSGSLMEYLIKDYYLTEKTLPERVIVTSSVNHFELLQEWLSKRLCTLNSKPSNPNENRLVKRIQLKFNCDFTRINNKELLTKEKIAALSTLRVKLGLKSIPKRIECFDISIIQGTHAVGSMVTFQNGIPLKRDYRKFKVHSEGKNDDVSMMKEVFYRRYSKKELDDPDLIIVDGGKGQLNAVSQLKNRLNLNIPIIGVAKKEELIFLENSKNPVVLAKDSHELFLIQRIRDEAHRFAISYHRKLRKGSSTYSKIDDIPGIGEKRRIILLNEFGGLDKLKTASIDEIVDRCKGKGIGRKQAELIHLYLQKSF